MAIVGALVLVGTGLDVYQRLKIVPTAPLEDEKLEDSSLNKALKSFSIYTNGKKVLNTDVAGSDHLGCLNGIR